MTRALPFCARPENLKRTKCARKKVIVVTILYGSPRNKANAIIIIGVYTPGECSIAMCTGVTDSHALSRYYWSDLPDDGRFSNFSPINPIRHLFVCS